MDRKRRTFQVFLWSNYFVVRHKEDLQLNIPHDDQVEEVNKIPLSLF